MPEDQHPEELGIRGQQVGNGYRPRAGQAAIDPYQRAKVSHDFTEAQPEEIVRRDGLLRDQCGDRLEPVFPVLVSNYQRDQVEDCFGRPVVMLRAG